MGEIKKLYDITLLGEKQVVEGMQRVNTQFDKAKSNFLSLKKTVGAGGSVIVDPKELEKERQALVEAEKALLRETTRKKEAKAEAQALLSARQQERNDIQKSISTNGALEGSYNDIISRIRLLKAEQKNKVNLLNLNEADIQKTNSEIRQLQDRINAFTRSLSSEGTNVGEYTRGIINALKQNGLDDLIAHQIDKSKLKMRELDKEFNELILQMNIMRTEGSKDFDSLEQKIIENRNEAEKLGKQMQTVQTEFRGMGSIGDQITSGLKKNFSSLKGEISSFLIGYVGFQAAFNGMRELVQITKELSDDTTNLEIELGKTAGGADKLVEGLSKLDTRTKLTVLEDIANTALKAGTAEENLLGVSAAVDKVKVAFGKDFGDIETGTETFAKLINIFYEDREITGDRILKIGNSVRTLANETVASVPYINDFTGRMAGLKQLFTNFKLSESIGLGAGFEEFKQSAETSSTAIVKILPKLAADTKKFAKVLGIPQEEFRKLLNDNPVEALIRVSEKLVKTKGGVEGVATAFADAELGAGRITTVLGTLGGKADVFRERIARAGATIEQTGAIEDAFNAKNENLAGTMDKVTKRFSDAANSKGFQTFVRETANVVLFFIKILTAIPFGVIITGISLLAAGWLYYKGASIAAGLADQWKNEQMLLGQIRLLAQRLGLIATTEATIAQTVATEGATVAQEGLNTAMAVSPLGVILALLALLVPVISAYASEADHAAVANLKFNDTEKIKKQVMDKAIKSTVEQTSKIDLLVGSLKDAKVSIDTKKESMEKLIAIDKSFDGVMENNIVNLDKLKEAYDKVTESIKLKANAEATASLLAEREKEVGELTILRKRLEIAASETRQRSNNKAATVTLNGLSENDQRVLGIDEDNLQFAQNQYDRFIKRVQDAETKAIETYKKYAQINAEAQKALKGDSVSQTTDGGVTNVDDPDNAASKLSGVEKDYLRDINALREAELSELKKLKLEGLITEEDFLQKSLSVNVKYNDQILAHFKGTDAITRKLRADTAADSINQALETNEKIFKIREDALKQEQENARAILQNELDNVTNDPGASPLDKEKAEQAFYEQMLALQLKFNADMDVIEKQFAQVSKKNAGDRANVLLKIQQDLNRNTHELSLAQYNDVRGAITDFATYRKNSAEIEASVKRMNVLRDKSLSQKEKERELDKINAALGLQNVNIELGALDAEIALNEKRFTTLRRTNEEQKYYNDLLRKRQLLLEGKAAAEQEVKIKGVVSLEIPSDSSTQAILKDKLLKIFKLEDSAYGGLMADVIASSFNTAQQAMENYFESERSNIEASKQHTLERIELEKTQLLAQAQSQRERDSIEKQAQLKRTQAEKEAGQRLKKVKKAEAAVALATELANIAVAAAANPANSVTFGAAGIAMYAALAGLAVARYALNIGQINKQEFGKGGLPTRGGQLTGPSHDAGGIPTQYGEFEGDELAIINKRSAKSNQRYTVSGTPKQIASAINEIGGGVRFATGAIYKKYAKGAYFGSSVQPPFFASYYTRTRLDVQAGADSSRMERLESTIQDLANIVYVETTKKVVLDPNGLSEHQRKTELQSNIATL